MSVHKVNSSQEQKVKKSHGSSIMCVYTIGCETPIAVTPHEVDKGCKISLQQCLVASGTGVGCPLEVHDCSLPGSPAHPRRVQKPTADDSTSHNDCKMCGVPHCVVVLLGYGNGGSQHADGS